MRALGFRSDFLPSRRPSAKRAITRPDPASLLRGLAVPPFHPNPLTPHRATVDSGSDPWQVLAGGMGNGLADTPPG